LSGCHTIIELKKAVLSFTITALKYLERQLNLILYFFEKGFVYTADRAYPVIRNIFERGAWFNAVVRITVLRIVHIAARAAYPFIHNASLLFLFSDILQRFRVDMTFLFCGKKSAPEVMHVTQGVIQKVLRFRFFFEKLSWKRA